MTTVAPGQRALIDPACGTAARRGSTQAAVDRGAYRHGAWSVCSRWLLVLEGVLRCTVYPPGPQTSMYRGLTGALQYACSTRLGMMLRHLYCWSLFGPGNCQTQIRWWWAGAWVTRRLLGGGSKVHVGLPCCCLRCCGCTWLSVKGPRPTCACKRLCLPGFQSTPRQGCVMY